ncbi:MAG TPA: hypothetical protein VKA59_14585 [Vicinamibacterales bacterium]|nr:hypothetical protein [Vicinamibacterales bacterium]
MTLVMAAPFANYRAFRTASYEGDARLIIWTLAWDNHAVLTRASLFDSNVFYPAAQSLAYNEHLFGLSLFTLPIYAVTSNPVLAYNIAWLASFLLNALAAHALLRRFTGKDAAAAAGSLIFTFSFYKMLHAHGHLHLVWTWLIPVSVLCLERWSERPTMSRAILWAGAVVLQSLTSWYLAVITALIQAIALVSHGPALRARGQLRQLWHLAVVTTVSALIVWPFAKPYRVIEAASRREVASNSTDLSGYLIPPENTWVGQLWLTHVGSGPRWIWGEQTVFLGWIAVLLAAAGAWRLTQLRQWRLLLVSGLLVSAGVYLSMGPSLTRGVEGWSLFGALSSLPGLGGFRAPARFALLVLLGLSLLGASGADWILTRTRRGAMIVPLLLALMLSEWYVVKFPGGTPPPFSVPAIYRTGALATARAVVSLPDYRGRTDWYRGSDYLYFSTAHWRPIVNGFGRSEPPEHARIISHMKAFPGPNNARTMRSLGVDYVVFHADRQPADAAAIIQEAQRVGEYELVARVGSDYLFRVLPQTR